MYLLSCGSFLHESMSMEDQVLAKHRFIQYILTYVGLLSHFTIYMYSDVFIHNSLFTNVYLSTSFDLKYGSLWANVQEHECIQKLSTKVLNVHYHCIGRLVTVIIGPTIWCTADWSTGPLI